MSAWPKTFPPLTQEQVAISNDFMKYWHEVLPKKYGFVDQFNHEIVVKTAPASFERTLEIGAGLGEHLEYEKLTDAQWEHYHAIDIRENMIAELRRRFPRVKASVADCQQDMGFAEGTFDRILAIHVLEHLPNLPAAVKELYKLCDKQKGMLQIVIPCEGGLAYGMARRISAQRIFEKRYKSPYRWFIEREHVNRPHEIMRELSPYFQTIRTTYFPLPIPSVTLNLCLGMNLRPKAR